MAEVRTYRNTRKTLVWLKKVDRGSGKEVRVQVHGGRTVDLSDDEVRFNEAAYFSDADNPFRNGTFANLAVIATEDDADALADATSDELGESEMLPLLKGPIRDLERRVQGITNATTLRRLHSLGTTAQIKPTKLDVVADRLASVDPSFTVPPPPPPPTKTAVASDGDDDGGGNGEDPVGSE